jgi:hypothetical protein
MPDTRKSRQIHFDLGDLRPQNPLPPFHRRSNGGIKRRAQASALGLKIDKGKWLRHTQLR